jgi:hypothetical protein
VLVAVELVLVLLSLLSVVSVELLSAGLALSVVGEVVTHGGGL